MNIIIIGAGPAGTSIAYELAKKKHNISIYENHNCIGEPIQCTGILTDTINKFIEIPKNIIARKIPEITIETYNNNNNNTKCLLKFKNPEIILYRNKFDQFMSKRAKNIGVKIYTNHLFKKIKNNNALFKTKNGIKKIKFDFLIGADGVHSKVRKYINIIDPEKFIGIQEVIEGDFKINKYQTFFSTEIKNSFAWIVPEEKNKIRIGLATKLKAKEKYDYFFKKIVKKRINKIKHINMQSGFIPIYNPNLVIIKNNIALIGDAGTHVKATTLGGIIPAIKTSHELSEFIHKKTKFLKNKELKIHKELMLHLIIRKIINKLSSDDMLKIINIFNEKKIKKLLETNSRDELSNNLKLFFNIAKKINYWPFYIKLLIYKFK